MKNYDAVCNERIRGIWVYCDTSEACIGCVREFVSVGVCHAVGLLLSTKSVFIDQ